MTAKLCVSRGCFVAGDVIVIGGRVCNNSSTAVKSITAKLVQVTKVKKLTEISFFRNSKIFLFKK